MGHDQVCLLARACSVLLVLSTCGCRARSALESVASTAAAGAPAATGDPRFGPTIPNATPPPRPAPPGMVWIPGGEFSMGAEESLTDARPVHRVYVDGFW